METEPRRKVRVTVELTLDPCGLTAEQIKLVLERGLLNEHWVRHHGWSLLLNSGEVKHVE